MTPGAGEGISTVLWPLSPGQEGAGHQGAVVLSGRVLHKHREGAAEPKSLSWLLPYISSAE